MSNARKHRSVKDNLYNLLINRFLPFWPLLVAFVIASMAVASVYIFLSKTYYESSAALLINDEEKGVDDSEMIESINYFKTKKIVENELEVLSSREIINSVVERLALYAPLFEESGFRTRNAYHTSPIRVYLKDPNDIKNYNPANKQKFTFDEKNSTVIIENESYPLDQWVINPLGKSDIKFTLNPKQKQSGDGPFYFTLVDPRIVTSTIQENLSASASSKLSTVVRLKYKNELPELGEDILTELIEVYKSAAVGDRTEIASNTLTFIESRITEVGKQLEDVEKELEIYRAEEGVINLSQQGTLYLNNVGEYDRRLTDIDIQLSVLNNVSRYVRSKETSSGIVPSTLGLNDPILSQLLQDLYEAEIEYEKIKKTTGENNPILVAIQNRIDKIRPSIIENVQNQRATLSVSRGNLSASSNRYGEALQVLPEQERKLIEITRRKTSILSLFDYLVQKREETALSTAPTISDAKLIEAPQSTLKPISPKKSLIYLLAICLSLGLGISIIGGREMISSNILFRSDLENLIDLPVAGELAYVEQEPLRQEKTSDKSKNLISRIKKLVLSYLDKLKPSIKRKQGLLTNHNDDIFITDQFRQILSYLGFYNRNRSIKKLMITSSIQGEGKSYVSSNLAQTLAFLGKKTALVDMDLRNQQVSTIFNLEKEKGISEYLKGQTSYGSLLKKIGTTELYVLPAGSKAINSSELMTNENLDLLFRSLEADFDYILLDTPPINMVSDAQTLNDFCDKTLLIVRHAFTPKFVLEHLDEKVEAKGLRNCAVVFNGVKNRGMVSYNYGYGYGYEVPIAYHLSVVEEVSTKRSS